MQFEINIGKGYPTLQWQESGSAHSYRVCVLRLVSIEIEKCGLHDTSVGYMTLYVIFYRLKN